MNKKTLNEGGFVGDKKDSLLEKSFNIFSTQLDFSPSKKQKEYKLETFTRSNQDTCLTHKPAVFEGDWVQSGDLLTDCANSVGGELALGQNIFIAYMPWEGYNFEDAILISERLVTDDLFTSVHIERYEIENIQKNMQGVGTRYEEITRDIPDVSPKEVRHLDSFGIVKIGSWIEEGDVLVGKITPINKKEFTPYQKLLYTILDKQIRSYRDSSLRAPKNIKAKVIDIKFFYAGLGERQTSSLAGRALASTKGGSQNRLRNTPKFKLGSVPQSPLNKNSKRAGGSVLKRMSAPEARRGVAKQHLQKFANYNINSSSHLLLKSRSSINQLRQILSQIRMKDTGATSAQGINFVPKTIDEWKTELGGVAQGPPPAVSHVFEHYKKLQRCAQRKSLKGKSPRVLRTQGSNVIKKMKKVLSKKSNLQHHEPAFYNAKSIQNIETIHIYLGEKRKVQVGDKMSGRHGNKGIVSQILPIQDMPFLPDGTPIDMVLNPLGVPSRMNVGQIYECLLGLAGKYLGENYKIPAFDEIYGADASRTFVFNKLYEARCKTGFKWLFNPQSPGKVRLFDGRTGDCFDQPITVGQAYILRLVHMVDDKIHMRSTGPYSLVTQQPLRGRSKQGGQRLGEMEVWALEGYGAAFTLLEMLTVKSDDLTGRMTLWSNLILNKDLTIGTPEAFKVLICELQALCLDIGLFRYNNNNDIDHHNAFINQTSSNDKKILSQIKSPSSHKTLTEMTNLMSFP